MSAQVSDNPLRAGMRLERTAEPCAIIIFGATGDLAKRKLIPALLRLSQQRLIPAEFAIVGISRQQLSDDEFRSMMHDAVLEFGDHEEFDESSWRSFANALFYLHGDFNSAATYQTLARRLTEVEKLRSTQGNRIFYLATAPEFFGLIAKNLGGSGLAQSEQGWTRVIVEKPFGYDLESARALNDELAAVFKENQIYRIDHYLGKETVQNLLVFRFANSIFEPLWNRQYIDHIQVTNAETVGVEGRGSYYDKAGVLRDMIQNHVFQVIALIAMEPPVSLQANSIRDEKTKVMQSVRPIPEDRID